MAFGEGFKHMDSFEQLADGNYTATIKAAKMDNKGYGDYIQCEVEIEGHTDAAPSMFLINDSPKSGYGSLSLDQAKDIWCKNMTKFFKNFEIKEGNFNPHDWIGHKGTVTVRRQKKNPQYGEIVPYVVQIRKAAEEKKPAEAPKEADIPEDMIF